MERIYTDVLVIGAGIAGSSVAKTLAESGKEVTVLCARELMVCNSSWAQGGIVFEEEDAHSLAKDIQYASQNSSNDKAIEFICQKGAGAIRQVLIEDLNVAFDKNSQNEIDFTMEAAHSKHRIIHVGDHTGKNIIEDLHGNLAKHPSIKVMENSCAIDLITRSHHSLDVQDQYLPSQVLGCYYLNAETGEVSAIIANHTVLATGGVGEVFSRSTNSPGSYGHGVAMAYRIGARVMNLEYVQFHPTVFYKKNAPAFLISEALRGEGIELVDHEGKSFMEKYHEAGSLAPRDIISRSIHHELLESKQKCVYLDARNISKGSFEKRFPGISSMLEKYGVDPGHDLIPVSPGAHFLCGGVYTDLDCRTTIQNLYAVGEVACTGLHGANRLASTSLLEGLTFGIHLGKMLASIDSDDQISKIKIPDWQSPTRDPDLKLINQDLQMIQITMWNYVGLIRNERQLARANRLLKELKTQVDSFYGDCLVTRDLLDLRNCIQTALLITHAAMLHPKSVGCHFRSDQPEDPV